MPWEWAPKSPLHTQTSGTPCESIFRGVCDELGRYFEPLGARYARSRPKLTFKRGSLKLEIGLWSSRSNIPGEYVNLEVVPSFFSLELAKSADARKGYLFGHPDIFVYAASGLPPGTVRIERLFDPAIERSDSRRSHPAAIYNNNVNVFGISTTGFEALASFVETRILSFFDVLTDKARLDSYLREPLAEREELARSQGMRNYTTATWGPR